MYLYKHEITFNQLKIKPTDQLPDSTVHSVEQNMTNYTTLTKMISCPFFVFFRQMSRISEIRFKSTFARRQQEKFHLYLFAKKTH